MEYGPKRGSARHDDLETWGLVGFIRKLPGLTPEELHEMEKMNPRSAHEAAEEQDEETFLRGDQAPQAPASSAHPQRSSP